MSDFGSWVLFASIAAMLVWNSLDDDQRRWIKDERPRLRRRRYVYLVAYTATLANGYRLGRCVFTTDAPLDSVEGIEGAERAILANKDDRDLSALLITSLTLLKVTRGGGA